MSVLHYRLKPGLYRDSVTLMRLSAQLLKQPGVIRASVIMATPANRAALEEAGLPELNGAACKPEDLLLAVEGRTPNEAEHALDWAEAELLRPTLVAAHTAEVEHTPRTLVEGVRHLPEANIVVIAVPGEYAYAEALKALKAKRHVFLFSSGVSLADEARLKKFAAARGLLMMGAECGTGLIAGAPLGFANVVRRGDIGMVAASGSGLQEVMCLIHNWGGGLSHAFGVGGRDLHERIRGLTTLAALAVLQNDPDTSAIVLLSKPPSPIVAERVLRAAAQSRKPCIIAFLGGEAVELPAGLKRARTLEDAARLALEAVGITAPRIELPAVPRATSPRRFMRGLFAGGTLCGEAEQILSEELGPITTLISNGRLPDAHLCLDLGDEAYTRGRPHPMIDSRLRVEMMRQAVCDPQTGVVLFDILLGYGASADPVGPLLDVLDASSGLAVITHVCGTDSDPQNASQQIARLQAAGVTVAPTNAAAARLALKVIVP